MVIIIIYALIKISHISAISALQNLQGENFKTSILTHFETPLPTRRIHVFLFPYEHESFESYRVIIIMYIVLLK